MGKLTELKIKSSKAKSKKYTVSDGGGLTLEIMPNASKRWRFRYRFEGLQQMLSLGLYPEVSLKEARNKHFEARKLLINGVNPSDARKAGKVVHGGEDCLEAIAREWHSKNSHKWTSEYGKQIIKRLELNIFPWLGKKQISKITPPELLKVLRRMEDRGAVETAHRIHACCGQILRYAIATGRAERDISQDLKGAIPPPKKQHLASITDPIKVGELLRAIDAYDGSLIVQCALKLAPLVFVRPTELRHAEWSEIDIEKAEWVIPANKMKAGEKHIVPLSKQAIVIIEEIRPLTGNSGASKYVFPSLRTLSRPMSNNAILSALRRMGYTKEEMTGHGFRSMASTLLNEQGYNRDHIERQLAHAERNEVRAAYNYAEYIPERTKMMQEWADYLDELRVGGEVINAKFGGSK